jgi:hypothetical protein
VSLQPIFRTLALILLSPLSVATNTKLIDQPPTRAVWNYLHDAVTDFQDLPKFAAESLTIANKQGAIVDLIFNRSQLKLVEAVRKQREKGRPVRLLIDKSRRQGLTVGIAALMFQETAFVDGQPALIVAHENKAARNIFGFYDHFNTHYKPFRGVVGLPRLTSRVAGQESGALKWANGSSIEIATARNLQGSRSFNFRRIHLSEYAFYPQIRTLMTALAATVPDDPDTIVIKETTANSYNEFYTEWMNAVDGKTDYQHVFFGCFDDADNIRMLDVEPDKFQDSMTDPEWELQARYSLALEQIYWRRKKLETDYRGDERMFDQEYPHSWEVSFLATGRPRFDPKCFVGMPITEGEKGRVDIQKIGRREVPIFAHHEYGELTVWRRPQENRDYVGGVDPVRGIDINEGVGTPDPDFAAAEIFDRELAEQVAELHERIEPFPLAQYLFDIGQWYNWVYWVIEVETSGGNGLAVLRHLQELGYPQDRIHFHRKLDTRTNRATDKPGYQVDGVTRPILISSWDRMLLERSVTLHSAAAVAQHRTFVVKATGRVEHQDGCHDDIVFACMHAGTAITCAPVRRNKKPTAPQRYGRPAVQPSSAELHRRRM